MHRGFQMQNDGHPQQCSNYICNAWWVFAQPLKPRLSWDQFGHLMGSVRTDACITLPVMAVMVSE
jgi:hypothetical protein